MYPNQSVKCGVGCGYRKVSNVEEGNGSMTHEKCELLSCRFNSGHRCTDEPNRKRCLDMCLAVLGDDYMRFFEKERCAEDDLR